MFAPALLQTLLAVTETGSFDLAAARLGVTPSAISQRMRSLTELAGGPLLARVQPAQPTALGRRVMRHARDVATLEADLAADLGQHGGPKPVSVAINADSLEAWAVPALAAAPGFRFDITIVDQDQSVGLLRRGEVSAAITSDATPAPGCDVVPLGALAYVACCTPAFHRTHFGQGVTADALRVAPVLQFTADDHLQTRWIRQVTSEDIHPPAHRIAAPGPFMEATRLGLGWGLNQQVSVARDLRAGTLVEILPDTGLSTPLYWQVSRTMKHSLVPLTDAMRVAARAVLCQR
ncbi:MAG: ArgP/LysG family DNA-binding transcriptional regulator [Pseudomonadota bacterium]